MSDPGIPLNMGQDALPVPQRLLQLLQATSGANPGTPPATAPTAAAAVPQPTQVPVQASGTARPSVPKPGDVVNYHQFAGGNPADPNAWKPLQGTDFITALHSDNPVMASQVQAILDGREKLPPRSRVNPTNRMLINAVYQADPDNFDAINEGARQKTRNDFTSGTSALNVRNINQAIGHLQSMLDEMPNVAGHGGADTVLGTLGIAQPVNHVINAYEQSGGQQGITNYQTAQTALSGEMASLLKGKGSSNETEVNRWVDNLSPDRSDEQKMGGARKLTELLKSRLDELNQQYQQGMGTTATPLQVLNPLAAKAYGNLSTIGQKVAPHPASPLQAPMPANNPSPQDIFDELKRRGW